MMKYMQRGGKSIAALTSADADSILPVGDVGILLAGFGYSDGQNVHVPQQFCVTFRVAGTTPTFVAAVWGRDRANQVWGPCGPDQGRLNAGAAITTSRHLLIGDVGTMDRIAIVLSAVGGTGLDIDAWVTPLITFEAG